MIHDNQKEECIRLYKQGTHTIKEIMQITGIRSEQTIYRILDAAGIPRKPTRPTDWRATISFDAETASIIDEFRPRNLSEWICSIIKQYYYKD